MLVNTGSVGVGGHGICWWTRDLLVNTGSVGVSTGLHWLAHWEKVGLDLYSFILFTFFFSGTFLTGAPVV